MITILLRSVFLAMLATCQNEIEFCKSARNFSMELIYRAAKETQWHSVISPLGIWSLLISVSIGATGNSKEQLLRTLNLPNEISSVTREHKNLIKYVILPATSEIDLKYNNFIFLDTNLTMEKEFEESIINDFGAKVKRIDFNSPVQATEFSNIVIQKSDTSVVNVFQPEHFQDTRMILTNTISFISYWQYPFNPSGTRVQDFHDETGKVIGKVKMMQQEGKFQLSDFNMISASVLELPYGETNKYSFLVFLPYYNKKLADVYSGLKKQSIKDILDQMKADSKDYGLCKVMVNLPRFKISTKLFLKNPLIDIGLEDIFDKTKARFDLVSKTKLHVSAIIHYAHIEVTETGTKASVVNSEKKITKELLFTQSFNVNRPFIFFIIEKSMATIIFSGVYSIPTLY